MAKTKTEKIEPQKNESVKAQEEQKPIQEAKKEVVKPVLTKKNEAVVKVSNLPISKKHSMYICTFIKGKKIDDAIRELGEVLIYKRAIPFKGEIPHRKNMMSGRFPINASAQFINLLKGLRGNSSVNGLNMDITRISFASASWDSRPLKRGGMKSKRVYILLKAKEGEVK